MFTGQPTRSASTPSRNRVSVHDFHATMLHLLGMDSRNLVFDRHGLKERLTDQYPARVVKELLA